MPLAVFQKEDKGLKAETHLQKALELIDASLHKQAMIEIREALDAEPEAVYTRLLKELERFSLNGNHDAALAIGLNLLKDRPDDFELANKLGNIARRSEDYEQATSLYQQALKREEPHPYALYNLAATMAKVDFYDGRAVGAVQSFDNLEGPIVPEYQGGPDFIEKIEAEIVEKEKTRINDEIQDLILKKEIHESAGENIDASGVELAIEALKKKPESTAKPAEIRDFLSDPKADSRDREVNLYNLVLYALKIGKTDWAPPFIKELRELKSVLPYVDLAEAITNYQKGNFDGSIQRLVKLLGKTPFNRYYNVALGLAYRVKGEALLSHKYLIFSRFLLDKSEGLYDLSQILKAAQAKLVEEKPNEALKFYQIVVSEHDHALAWERIGLIFLKQKKYIPAANAYKKLLGIVPKSKEAIKRLKQIHDHFVSEGDSLNLQRKFEPAAKAYETALKIFRDIDTLRKTASVYANLKNTGKEQALLDELYRKKVLEEEKNKERERLQLICKADSFAAKKQYLQAIDFYENAFRRKLDKEVFLKLAQLYKGLKKTSDFQNLIERWNAKVAHEEKMQKYRKLKDREAKGAD